MKTPYEIGKITGMLRAKLDSDISPTYVAAMAQALKYNLEASRQFARGFKSGFDGYKQAQLQSLKQ